MNSGPVWGFTGSLPPGGYAGGIGGNTGNGYGSGMMSGGPSAAGGLVPMVVE